MKQALRAYLLAQSGVSSVVADRAYWNIRPQGASLPALVFRIISGVPEYAMDGNSGLVGRRVQIDCYGKSQSQVEALAGAVRDPLDGKRFTQDSIQFEAFRDDERDMSEAGTTEAERVHRISLDFKIWHQE